MPRAAAPSGKNHNETRLGASQVVGRIVPRRKPGPNEAANAFPADTRTTRFRPAPAHPGDRAADRGPRGRPGGAVRPTVRKTRQPRGGLAGLVAIARGKTPDPIPNSAVKTLSADGTAPQGVEE